MNPRRSFFDQMAPMWDSLPSPPDAPERVARFVRAVVGMGRGRVLDVGCGTGLLLPALACCDVSVVECDLAEAMLAGNRQKALDAGWTRHSWACADALRLPFPDAAFDYVLAFGVMPHLGEPRHALAEFLRCLKPGGLVGIGHLMGSEELNGFHAALEPPVNEDLLVSAPEMGAVLAGLGAHPLAIEEEPDWYLVAARR